MKDAMAVKAYTAILIMSLTTSGSTFCVDIGLYFNWCFTGANIQKFHDMTNFHDKTAFFFLSPYPSPPAPTAQPRGRGARGEGARVGGERRQSRRGRTGRREDGQAAGAAEDGQAAPRTDRPQAARGDG